VPRGAHLGPGGVLEPGRGAHDGTSGCADDSACETSCGCLAQCCPRHCRVSRGVTCRGGIAECGGGSLARGSRIAECCPRSRRSDKLRTAHRHAHQGWRDG